VVCAELNGFLTEMAPASLEASTSIVWDGGTESFASNNNNWSTMYSLRCNDGFYTLRNCCLMRLSRSFSFKVSFLFHPFALPFKQGSNWQSPFVLLP